MSDSASDRQRKQRLVPLGSTAQFANPEAVWPQLLLILLTALVFYLPNEAQLRIQTGLRGLNVVNILFILAVVVMLLCQRPKSEPVPLKQPLLAMAAVFTFALFVALFGDASAWVEDVTVYKNILFYPLLYVLFFFAVRDLRTLRWLLGVTVLIFFTSSVLGVRQALDYGIGTFHDHKRVAAPFGWELFDANRSAIFFCIHLQFIGAAALFLKSRPWLRTACAVLYFMGVFVVFFTYSRQALFILAFVGLLMLARKQFLLTIAFLFALYHYEIWVPETVVERVQMTTLDPFDFETRKVDNTVWDPFVELDKPFTPQARGKQFGEGDTSEIVASTPSFDVSTESRFTLWSGAFEMIKRRPWGVGLNRFRRDIGAFVPIGLAGKDAHNVFVLFASEAGVWAPFVLVALLALCIRLGLRLARLQDDESRALGIGLVFATVAAALGNLYGSRYFDGDVMGNYWVLLALCARLLVIKQEELRQRQAAGPKALVRGAYLGPRGLVHRPASMHRTSGVSG